MEKGKIRSVASHGGDGSISDGQGQMIGFNSSSIVGRDRSGLKIGDMVWFERVGAMLNARAINIRKC